MHQSQAADLRRLVRDAGGECGAVGLPSRANGAVAMGAVCLGGGPALPVGAATMLADLRLRHESVLENIGLCSNEILFFDNEKLS